MYRICTYWHGMIKLFQSILPRVPELELKHDDLVDVRHSGRPVDCGCLNTWKDREVVTINMKAIYIYIYIYRATIINMVFHCSTLSQ